MTKGNHFDTRGEAQAAADELRATGLYQIVIVNRALPDPGWVVLPVPRLKGEQA
ncbi:hypothetical protein D516_3614 [Rhodobacter sp. AKP1]|nr:hypothetical protein D516_3614 [Rhodobacter sp. AKP1]